MAQAKAATTPEKNLIRFNIKNVKYAFPATDGGFTDFAPMGTASKLAIETDASEKSIYGDGKRIIHYNNEKGKTGTVSLNTICNEYEIACGRKKRLDVGLADIKPTKNVPHVLYYEICEMNGENEISVAKGMLYGVTSTRPAESYDQTTDDINESSFDLPLVIDGTPLLAADGSVYKDAKGNEVSVWGVIVTPDMDGYADFGKEVVLPKNGTSAETPAV